MAGGASVGRGSALPACGAGWVSRGADAKVPVAPAPVGAMLSQTDGSISFRTEMVLPNAVLVSQPTQAVPPSNEIAPPTMAAVSPVEGKAADCASSGLASEGRASIGEERGADCPSREPDCLGSGSDCAAPGPDCAGRGLS